MIDAAARRIAGPEGRASVEPRAMQVLVALASTAGALVTRDQLLRQCWGSALVGDDSLNRAIALLRRALRETAGGALAIETVAGAGYLLSAGGLEANRAVSDADCDSAISAGWAYWKSGEPRVDEKALRSLRSAAAARPKSPEIRAMLALALRQAAEYSELDQCADMVAECEREAMAALSANALQPHAEAALIGLAPIYGDWAARRTRLLDLLARAPGDMVALHELAILEMATGRVRAAVDLLLPLIERDPLAATFHYKRVYHCWSIGDWAEMDRVADRAMQLWPKHSAIWFARLWTMAFTGRPERALDQLRNEATRPAMPTPALEPVDLTFSALAAGGDTTLKTRAVEANLRIAERGPAQSVAATMCLSALGEGDAAILVAEGYLLRTGPVSVGIHKTASDPSITDQHRRVTQMLFVPVTAPMRANRGFDRLCDQMGLTEYWNRAAICPDFKNIDAKLQGGEAWAELGGCRPASKAI